MFEEETITKVLTKLSILNEAHVHAGVKECHWVWRNLRAWSAACGGYY